MARIRSMTAVERLREILKGIDQTEDESEEGWWETSAGAEFGAMKLREVESLVGMLERMI